MKSKKTLYLIIIALLSFLIIGISYAFFNTIINGNSNAKDVVVEAGTLKLTYIDGPAINVQNIKPGWNTTKTVSVKNTGTLEAAYNVVWQELTNEITNDELVISATCKRLNASGIEEGTCKSITELPVKSKTISKNISIEAGFTHEYTFTILFKETGTNQNYNMKKTFEGKLGIEEYKDTVVYCTFDGELTQGAEYVNGQYTYRYKQEGKYASSGIVWKNILSDGWGVQLTDKTSTEPVTSDLCTYINNKPIVSMSYMFSSSKVTTLDVSHFVTSNVTNMSSMFSSSKATTLDLSNFNTSKVTDMDSMFENSKATTLDLSSFDTSNVTNMRSMFSSSKVTTLDLSGFDTSNVTDMGSMFSSSEATTLDLSNFNTSKVTDMRSMFENSKATTLDLHNFDTSNVTKMRSMFSSSKATTLDLSNFNTSKVTDMSFMFSSSQATTLDVSSFDTSNVTNMRSMFSSSKVTTLDVSHFVTSNVTNMSFMFYNSSATTLDVSHFDTSNVTDMGSMFSSSKVTTLDLSGFDTSNVTKMRDMFISSINLKTIYVSSKFNTNNVTDSTNMFNSCINLVGGAGTTYDSTKVDKTYAHIDGGTSSPGYFTVK